MFRGDDYAPSAAAASSAEDSVFRGDDVMDFALALEDDVDDEQISMEVMSPGGSTSSSPGQFPMSPEGRALGDKWM